MVKVKKESKKRQTREQTDSSESDDSFEMSDLEFSESKQKKHESGVALKRNQKAELKQTTKEDKAVAEVLPKA